MTALGENPIHCMRCNLEVSPEDLPLPLNLVDPVADWARVHRVLELLWLDSGPYEVWATKERTDPSSPANQRGLLLRSQLDPVRRCYYWLGDIRLTDTTHCPICAKKLTTFEGAKDFLEQLVCHSRSLVFGVSAEGAA